MITWTCKGPLAAAALTTLSACEGGQGAGLLNGLGALAPTAKSKAFSQADMANGAVVLKAPQGFCIDGHSLKPRFAIMARCDRLGAPSSAAAAPLGVIVVSVSPAPPGTALPAPEVTAAAHGLGAVSQARGNETEVLFRATGPAPADDLDGMHWRGTALINGYLLGVALYGARGNSEVSDEGPGILKTLFAASRAAP